MFNLTDVEVQRVNEMRNAAELLFGEKCIVTTSYMFTPNGIASELEIILKLKNGVVIQKNISDTESW